MIDKRNKLLDDRPFSYKKTKANKALIYWNGRLVRTIHGKKFEQLIQQEQMGDEFQLQLFLAKITGHFKHGNER